MLTEQQIRQTMSDTNNRHDWFSVDKNAKFADLNLDSLDQFEIIVAFQETTGIEIPDEDVDKLQCMADIESYFANR
jgi:acyl carrier protein